MSSSRPPAYVQFENVTLRGPRGPIFPDTTLVVEPSQRWAVLGPNGSGKGLLLSAMMGKVGLLAGRLRHPFLEGEPRFADSVFGVLPPGTIALASMREHRQWLLARDFHQLRWHGSLASGRATVGQLLGRALVEERNPFAVLDDAGEAAYEAARQRESARFELGPLLHRPAVALSNGELHRFVLARALLRRPRLLLVEEPMAGLDSRSRARLLEILDELHAEGLGVILASEHERDLPGGVSHVVRVEAGAVRGAGLFARRSPSEGAAMATPTFSAPVTVAGAVAAAAPVLDMRDVGVRHGAVTLLDGITWQVAAGEHWALLGPNGSGKSTLLSLVLADNPQIYANDVRVAGQSLGPGRSIWDQKAHLGWLSPELETHTPPDAAALEVVISGFASSLGLHRERGADEVERARAWLACLGLAGEGEARFADLAPVARRLVLLARAVVHRPALLLLDEPCQGLDARGRTTLLAALGTALAALGAAMIYVTHLLDEIPASVTKVLALDGGRVRYQGSRAGFRPDPHHTPP